MTAFYSWLARAASRRPWAFVVVWVVLLGAAGAGAGRVGHALNVGGFSLPGTQFHAASGILAHDLGFASDKTALVVIHSDPEGPHRWLVTDKDFHDRMEDLLARLKKDPLVSSIDSFYTTGIPDLVSPDNHTTYALVKLRSDAGEKEVEEATPRLRGLVHSDDLDVYVVGQPAAFHDVETATADDLVRVEKYTFPLVFLVLLLVFGSLVAAAIPLVVGAACVLLSLGSIYLLSRVSDVSIFALNTASMIGLGLAIDFSLIMVSRFREELAHRPLPEALDAMLQTAGRSVTFSGVTLMLTMAVLTLFPVMVIYSIALAVTVVAGAALLVALLLLPAVLVLLGPHLDRLSVRRLLPGKGAARQELWHRWAHAVMARPWTWMIVSLVILGVLALPALQLRRGGVTDKVLPETAESRRGIELLQRQFGGGEAAPLLVVVQAPLEGGLWDKDHPEIREGIYDLHTKLAADPRVARVQSLASLIPNPSADWIDTLSLPSITTNPDRLRIARRLADIELPDGSGTPGANRTTVLLVFPHKNETDPETAGLLLEIRAHAKEWAPGLAGARVLVGGAAAQQYDFDTVVYGLFPLLLFLSLLVTYFILMVFFHSLILPVKAILLNLLSLAASYGILVLVFQYGYGDRLLGFTSLGFILGYTPVLLFSLLFGLSTDYEVFLLTRVREYVRQGYPDDEAVARGLEQTAGIITAAGLIMITIFGSFALTRVLVIKELGFGLAVAVFLDTTLVRIVLVPATMKLMGHWNWWMPRVLDRVVPEIDEGEPAGKAGVHAKPPLGGAAALT
jgi:RND superfamily putative drug exporter